jgi:hypothetical protein
MTIRSKDFLAAAFQQGARRWLAAGGLARAALLASCVGLSLLTGCTTIGPASVVRDRFDYSGAISDSWKRQMLLNLLKIRYTDAPVFLDVTSVINSYTLSRELEAYADFAKPGRGDQVAGISVNGTYEDRPTITYAPLTGDKFARSLMTPIPVAGLLYLLQSGYPADVVLRMTVNTISGLQNVFGGQGNPLSGDPRFFELIENMRASQAAGGMGMRIKQVEGNQVIVLVLRHDSKEDASAANRRIRELLRLNPDARELSIIYGTYPANDTEIAILTRSMLQIMTDIASYIEVPPDDAAQGRVYVKPRSAEELALAPPLIRIRQGEELPADAFAATRYRERWFWIDDTDMRSKGIFSFLMFMFALTETGETLSRAPVVTVPAR